MRNFNKSLAVIIIISTGLLLLALIDHSYWYYQLLRIVVTLTAALLVYRNIKNSHSVSVESIIFGIVAILFNPIFPIYLEKSVWHIIDVIVAILFIGVFVKHKLHVDLLLKTNIEK